MASKTVTSSDEAGLSDIQDEEDSQDDEFSGTVFINPNGVSILDKDLSIDAEDDENCNLKIVKLGNVWIPMRPNIEAAKLLFQKLDDDQTAYAKEVGLLPLEETVQNGVFTLTPEEVIASLAAENRLGEGTFGAVYKATIGNKAYAVKIGGLQTTMKEHFESWLEFVVGYRSRSPFIVRSFAGFFVYSGYKPHTIDNPEYLELFWSVFNENVAATLAGTEFVSKILAKGRRPESIVKGGFYPVIVMELAEGTLDSYLENLTQNTARMDELFSFMWQLTTAVWALHSCGLVHRDLKPPNCLVFPGGRIKLSDFGTVSFGNMKSEGCGSPLYIPPEAFDDSVDKHLPASDIFSLGMLFWETIRLVCPHDEYKNFTRTLFETMANEKKREKDLSNMLSVAVDDITKDCAFMKQLLMLMTAVKHKDRPPIQEVRYILRKVLSDNKIGVDGVCCFRIPGSSMVKSHRPSVLQFNRHFPGVASRADSRRRDDVLSRMSDKDVFYEIHRSIGEGQVIHGSSGFN